MKDDFFTIEKLYQAYRTCRRHKRGTFNALRFEARLLDQLCDLRDELVGRTYHPTTSICFVQRRPKLREIFAADFRDRVVHHLLVGHLEPIFERRFIHDSYACRQDKGVHAGVTRLRGFVNQVTANGTQRSWYLKEDVAGFFMNIDKEVLYQLVCRAVQRADVQWLARTLIFHDCTEDYHFKGKRGLLQHIPPHKTLFKVPPGKGLPIGNLTSQFFANVYLNELDHFVKRTLRCRYYVRYCDDFILLGTSLELLTSWREAISIFLRDTLQLELNHSQHRLRPVADGIDFLGYIVRRRYVLVRRRVVNHLQERLDRFERQLSERRRIPAALPARNSIARATLDATLSGLSLSPEHTDDGAVGRCHVSLQTASNHTPRTMVVTAWRYPPHTMQLLRSVVASYFGHFRWADTRKLTAHLFVRYPLLRAAFMLQASRLVPRYLEGTTRSRLRWAYRWWVPPAPPASGRARVNRCCGRYGCETAIHSSCSSFFL